IMALAIRVNDFLSGLFLGVGIRLVDFKMETGRLWENDLMRIVVADEISPDSCRLWDIKSNEKLDKDRFRRDLGGLVEAYTEGAKRLGIMSEGERPQGTGPGLVKGQTLDCPAIPCAAPFAAPGTSSPAFAAGRPLCCGGADSYLLNDPLRPPSPSRSSAAFSIRKAKPLKARCARLGSAGSPACAKARSSISRSRAATAPAPNRRLKVPPRSSSPIP